MKNYKYISNNGLAFDEERVMKKLSKLAKEGWHLKEMTTWRYKLEKGEPADLQYAMDYKNLDGENKEEYIEMMTSSGWKYVCSNQTFHFFVSKPGTTPLYTDKESYLEKNKEMKGICHKGMLFSLIPLFIFIILSFVILNPLEAGFISVIYILCLLMAVIIGVPSLMMSVAYAYRERKQLKNNF